MFEVFGAVDLTFLAKDPAESPIAFTDRSSVLGVIHTLPTALFCALFSPCRTPGGELFIDLQRAEVNF